jgi:hypothetical protein
MQILKNIFSTTDKNNQNLMLIPEEGVLFSYFFFVSHNHDFFHASSVVGRLLFQGNNGAGFKTVKVFVKNTTRSLRRCGDFSQNPQGLTLTVR